MNVCVRTALGNFYVQYLASTIMANIGLALILSISDPLLIILGNFTQTIANDLEYLVR